ncbi:MAG TPA: HDOD domain-containing protein [Candidatus Acidoferrales bacterium]|nr:HDOD domain-containing protein [Candidatus Acidoferrales bacterium]
MYERFVARQPIFDSQLKVFAYELLFRAGNRNVFEPRVDASSRVIVDSATLFDLQTLTGPVAKAFVNADEPALLRSAPRLLPAQRIVVEILETVNISPEVLKACADLSAAGYTLALDDFADHPRWQPLLPLARFLKVDFRASDSTERRAIAKRYRSNGIQLLAEKVETAAEVQEARSLGYSYFQGFFFCKPVMVSGKDIPGNKANYLQLLAAISEPVLSFPKIERLLKAEPSLVYKLLRYLNSPIVGLRVEVHSIREAIALIGEIELRRWISIVAVVAMASDKSSELVRTALTRAYFCEEFARLLAMTDQSADLFLMGLLSVADALLDRPFEQILPTLPVSDEIRVALSGGANRFRNVYETLLAYERADWPSLSATVARFGTLEEQVPSCYLAAATRAGSLAP